MIPSHFQQAVYDWAASGQGHGNINAVAGSGKTTTAVEMIKRFDPMDYGLMAAFGRDIKATLEKKVTNPNVEIKTYNGFGWSVCLRNLRKKPKLEEDKTEKILRYEILDNKDTKKFYKFRFIIKRLVSLFKNMNIHSPADAIAKLSWFVERFDLDLPDDPTFAQVLADTYDRCINTTGLMDFDDQKFMPLYLGFDIPQFDYLVIDEYQDTCLVESELMERSCERGRIIVLGDPDQCIYSFKGTTPDAMASFQNRKDATQLPLSICYRCPRAVIAEAQKIVPRIEAAPNADEGSVDEIDKSTYFARVRSGDLVLCRVTLHLVSSCLKLIREGREAYVQGREVGDKLERLVDRIASSDDLMDSVTFYHELNAYEAQRRETLVKLEQDNRLLNLQDECDTLKVLLENCNTVGQLKERIKSLFKKDGSGIRHMTGHKSKGLESGPNNDVYILRPDLVPHPRASQVWMQEEENRLLYVMRTRAQRGLYYVRKDRHEK